ncbi:DUF1428 domain-containing protein [Candidatus Woesearchaeota archaeon]|nr:MAG: DUF1428 domain-containing protein [Candidatus Woesearchaeota archaeon]
MYVDGFVLPVPTKNLKAYSKMAQAGGKIWKKHGALQYFECVGDDLTPNMGKMKIQTFPKLVKPKKGETILFSFIIYKSKAHRNAVNAKVMKDPAMNDPAWTDKQMPFDVKRMAYGGFKAIVKV